MGTDKHDVKEYADGWITEKKGTEVPGFLKVSYLVIGLGATVLLIVDRNGEVYHSTRGALVRQFNLTSHSADLFIYIVAGMILVGLLGLTLFAFRKSHDL